MGTPCSRGDVTEWVYVHPDYPAGHIVIRGHEGVYEDPANKDFVMKVLRTLAKAEWEHLGGHDVLEEARSKSSLLMRIDLTVTLMREHQGDSLAPTGCVSLRMLHQYELEDAHPEAGIALADCAEVLLWEDELWGLPYCLSWQAFPSRERMTADSKAKRRKLRDLRYAIAKRKTRGK